MVNLGFNHPYRPLRKSVLLIAMAIKLAILSPTHIGYTAMSPK